ncbi:MAG: hypothetical protein Q7V57_00465 [Actinomycetota bacterium]|nr:hypothetical protein [Actinomycetota bacterium]
MSALLDDFARRHAADVYWDTSEWFVAAERVPDLLLEVQAGGVRILGLEGVLVDGDNVYPSSDRIADFSRNDSQGDGIAEAFALLSGPWRSPPRPHEQMTRTARGRHMIAVVLDD